MTGKYPARLHLTDFIAGQNRPFEKLTIPRWTKYMKLEEITIAEALRAAGYATAHVGKWHLEPPQPPAGQSAGAFMPTGHGFDVSVRKPKGTRGFFLPERFQFVYRQRRYVELLFLYRLLDTTEPPRKAGVCLAQGCLRLYS